MRDTHPKAHPVAHRLVLDKGCLQFGKPPIPSSRAVTCTHLAGRRCFRSKPSFGGLNPSCTHLVGLVGVICPAVDHAERGALHSEAGQVGPEMSAETDGAACTGRIMHLGGEGGIK